MKVGALQKILKECNKSADIIIFAMTEDEKYRPFHNISASILNKGSGLEELHLDVSVYTEYRSIHFPNNPTKYAVEELMERKKMLLEELEEIEQELGAFNEGLE